MSFPCDLCGIYFKTNQSYQRHLQTNKHILRQEQTRNDMLQCNQCNKWFCGKSGIYHHRNVCSRQRNDNQIHVSIQEIMQQQMEEMKQTFEKERQEMKKDFEETMKEQINKIRAVTTNNIESQQINININAFGNENTDYIDDKAILGCINRVYKSIPSILAKIHFDPKHPENHNIKITNKKLPYASVMGNNRKWKTVDRKDAIETMVINGFNLLDEKYIENKDKILTTKQHNFEEFQSKFATEDKDLMKQIKTDVDMMVLNAGN